MTHFKSTLTVVVMWTYAHGWPLCVVIILPVLDIVEVAIACR